MKVYELKREGNVAERLEQIHELAKEWRECKTLEEMAREKRKKIEQELIKLLPRHAKGTQHIETESGTLTVQKRKNVKWKGNPQPVLEKYPNAFKITYTPRYSVLDKILRTHNGDGRIKEYIQQRMEIEEKFVFKFEKKEEREGERV